MIHESMSLEVQADLGSMICHFGSLHCYYDELAQAEQVLKEVTTTTVPMPRMRIPLSAVVNGLIAGEHAIRNGENISNATTLDHYWRGYLGIIKKAFENSKSPSSPDDPMSSWLDMLQR